MEEHSAPIYKWRLLPDIWLNNGRCPREASIATLCRALPHQMGRSVHDNTIS